MRDVARARWETVSVDVRRAVGQTLVEARRRLVPMMSSRAAVPDGSAQPCDRCGRTPAKAYAPHPLRTHTGPTWRCARHAWAPSRDYVCPAYRRPIISR
jgi:hypothetical protein